MTKSTDFIYLESSYNSSEDINKQIEKYTK